jgi:cell division protein FtsB
MKNFERNRGRKNILESPPALALLGIVVLVFAWSVIRFWGKMAETRKNKDIAEAKTEALLEQKDALRSDIEKLRTDRGKEEFFRENYGLAKEGEDVIVIVDKAPEKEAEKRSAISGFFSFFVNLFK